MSLFISVGLLLVGLLVLVKGADVFVEASSGISKNFNVSNLVIGLTVMAFGTSAPEAFIGVRSALNGTVELAMGNVIGSDIFNLIFIIGLAAIIAPIAIDFKSIAKDYGVAILGPVLLLIMMLIFNNSIPRWGSFIFLVIFFLYVAFTIKKLLSKRGQHLEVEANYHIIPRPLKQNIFFAVLGLAGIIIGGELVVHYASNLATTFGMSPRLIGITIVALGTSLPELIIVISASKRKENQLAVGNIIGSSIFNILFVLGLTGIISPLPISTALIFDLTFLIGASGLFLIFILTKKRLSRVEGGILVLLYFAYFFKIIVV